MKMLLGVRALTIGAILAVIPTPASAQSDEQRAGARSAGLAGLDAYQAGKFEQAVDFFSRAESLMHAPTHLLYLARSHVKLGHLVSAREFYLKLTQDHLAATASKPFRDAQTAGEKELNELEPRVPYVSVVVQGGGAKDVQVTRDGERIPDALLGVPHPEDPGSHTFKASAENMESAESSLTLKEGAHETVLLTLSPSAARPAAARPAAAAGSVSFGNNEPEATDGPSSGHGLRIAGIVTGGVGLVGVGVGTAFLLKGSATRKKADDGFKACDATQTCKTPELQYSNYGKADADATHQQTVGAVSLAIGGAVLVTGVILIIVDSSSSSSASASRTLKPVFGLNYAGLSGSF